MKPDSGVQFRNRTAGEAARVYMGGTAMSCGQHPSLPQRHRWGPWRRYDFASGPAWDRLCLTCALTDDLRWTDPKGEQKNG